MSTFQPAWACSGAISTDPTSRLISQFPAPPSTTMMQPYQQCFQGSSLAATAAYTPPAVISLGEEFTDETLPESQTSYLTMEDEDEEFDYDDSEESDDEDYSSTSPLTPSSSSATHGQGAIPALWHAEHARLVNLQNAVLDNERAARSRELKLESEVARIKDNLARLKEARALGSTSSALSTSSVPLSPPPSATVDSTALAMHRACGPRGPRPRPQQAQTHRAPLIASTSSSSSDHRQVSHSAAITNQGRDSMLAELAPPLLGKFSFEEEDDTTETVLSNHLTEARSARAQERQKRKKEYERIRELSMLLTLGSEVRKWEERLAWQQSRSASPTPSSDDMDIESSTKSSNRDMDTDPDPRGKRLSRSFSLPSRGSYIPTPAASTSNPNRSGPPSPALPSLSLSPLWRVSAEMILRRRSLAERPRRIPPKSLLPNTANPVEQQDQPQSQAAVMSTSPLCTLSRSDSGGLARNGQVLRGPREQRSGNSNPSDLASTPTVSSSMALPLGLNASGVSSASSSPSSGKRYSIPPPITIPPNSQFTTSSVTTATGAGMRLIGQQPSTAMSNGVSFMLSKTTPVKPSTLKWAFTADDLAREMELEEQKGRTTPTATDSSSSSSESESDDSAQSSSCGSSSSSSEESQPVERRGRARFSWRRSLPKDANNAAQLNLDV